MRIRLATAAVLLFAAGLGAASNRDPRAPQRLAETGLYMSSQPGTPQTPLTVDPRNRPFSPQYPLWSDGAAKVRWVFLPPGTSIDTTDANAWQFPVGTRFWKEFAFNGRKVETRFLWRATPTQWVFASYRWNEDGTDATLAPATGVDTIPSVADCRACHEGTRIEPLGFNALQLSTDRDPNAIHGEPLAPGMVTVKTLSDERRLSPARPELVATPPRIQAGSPLTRSVLGYLAANCGGCHNRGTNIALLGTSLKHGDVANGDAVLAAMARHKTSWQVPGVPAGETRLLNPDSPAQSALLVRMRSRRPSSQMPPLGTIVEDRQAIDALTQWIGTEVMRVR